MTPDRELGQQLVAEIERDLDDVQRYAVYGDWLQRRGDPHGELIALQIAAAHDASLQPAADAFLQAHARALLGNLVDHEAEFPNSLTLRWRYGFVRGARIVKSFAPAYRALRAHLLSRYLIALEVLPHSAFPQQQQELIDQLARDPPPCLAALYFGVPSQQSTSYRRSDRGGYLRLGELWSRLPGLRRLVIDGDNHELGTLALPELRDVELRGIRESRTLAAIATATVPRLERLVIGGTVEQARVATAAPSGPLHGWFSSLAPLFARTDLPELRYLGIPNCGYADDVCMALPGSPLLPRLAELDLSVGLITDRGATELCDHARAFRHLRRLDVSWNQISSRALEDLRHACPAVVSEGQYPMPRR